MNNKVTEKLSQTDSLPKRKYDAYCNIQVYIKQLCGKGAYAGMFDGVTNIDVKATILSSSMLRASVKWLTMFITHSCSTYSL